MRVVIRMESTSSRDVKTSSSSNVKQLSKSVFVFGRKWIFKFFTENVNCFLRDSRYILLSVIQQTMTEKEDVTKQPEKEPLDDEALEKLAVEELMREAVQGAARAEKVGPSGWVRNTQPKPNKRFLVNTIRNAVSSNDYYSSKRTRHYRHHSHSPIRDHYPDPLIKKERSKRKH